MQQDVKDHDMESHHGDCALTERKQLYGYPPALLAAAKFKAKGNIVAKFRDSH